MRQLPRHLWCVGVAVLLGSAVGLAEPTCNLDAGRQAFVLGRLGQVEIQVEGCLAADVDRSVRAPAYELLAKSLLELDQTERAAEAVRGLFAADLEYRTSSSDSPRFVNLVNELRPRAPMRVTSVSKGGESLREAPATVLVVTAEQIRRRGYLDLEAILHDLPGFDIARISGPSYSVIYPRGLAALDSDRLLLVIDGVEQNFLFSNVAYLSRQYPLSNIDRVEVVYGPASTMYGANAFAGVINVITKSGSDLVAEGERIGVEAHLTGGSWATWSGDVTAGGVGLDGDLSWSLTARAYRSDGFDLSDHPEWDYVLEDAPYDYMQSLNPRLDSQLYADLVDTFGTDLLFSDYYEVDVINHRIRLSDAGVARVRELDQAAYDQTQFSNPVDDWSLGGRFRFKGFELGLQVWRRQEAKAITLSDSIVPGVEDGVWHVPEQTSMYARYSTSLREDLSLTTFMQYKRQVIDHPSSFNLFRSYALGLLDALDLMNETPSFFEVRYVYHHASQLRSDMNLKWNPRRRLSVVGGFEIRDSSIDQESSLSQEPNPADGADGLAPARSVLELGAYSQATYRFDIGLSLAIGLRFDHNQVGQTGGYGSQTTPRLALVYSRPVWTAKAVFAEGFKDAPMSQRYNSSSFALGNPELEPESARNTELSIVWHPGDDLGIELAAFSTTYSDMVGVVENGEGLPQFQNLDEATRVRGLQAAAHWRHDRLSLRAYYSYTDPDDLHGLIVAKVAPHKVNLVMNYEVMKHLNLNLRANWVDDRPAGPGTTNTTNPVGAIDSFTVVNGAITYYDLVPGADLQLIINNLFDQEYGHPSYGNMHPRFGATQIPQPGRSLYLRLFYKY